MENNLNNKLLLYLDTLIDKERNAYWAARRVDENGTETLSREADLITLSQIYDIIKKDGEPSEALESIKSDSVDMVNHPNHYTMGKYEVIDVIKDWLTEEEFRGYIKGNALKYVSRERLKNGDEDLKKTIFYLNYMINGKKSDKDE